jgi:hypothetical protein
MRPQSGGVESATPNAAISISWHMNPKVKYLQPLLKKGGKHKAARIRVRESSEMFSARSFLEPR